jgi:hypothetical protein
MLIAFNLLASMDHSRSRDSLVGIATVYGMDAQDQILSRGNRFISLHSVQTSFGAHSASYPMDPSLG